MSSSGEAAEVVAGQANRRQRRIDLVGEWHVVVPDDRDVVGALEPDLAEHPECTDRNRVVVREDTGGRLLGSAEQLVSEDDPRLSRR